MAAAVFVCCGCLADKAYVVTPEEQERQETPATAKDYTVTVYESFATEVGELSGLCLNQKKDGLYAVGDEGEVYEIGFDGKTRKTLMRKGGHDWEGVDCLGNDLLLMEETESTIYKLSGDRLSEVAKIDVPGGGASGKGPEGIMCVNSLVYVGNQAQPTRIVKYNMAQDKTEGWFDIKFVTKNISDLCYDSTDNTMWVIDSKGPAFYHCTLEGTLIATYHIPFVEQAEGLAVDHAQGTVWVGCDKTSKLYRIKIEL
ncbi:MAG: SdiA-regulated domain-containing protein [Bacteroidales bacterium]|nr:SdiA-regulated domain-containing protein [Bacteroidales bacterium]